MYFDINWKSSYCWDETISVLINRHRSWCLEFLTYSTHSFKCPWAFRINFHKINGGRLALFAWYNRWADIRRGALEWASTVYIYIYIYILNIYLSLTSKLKHEGYIQLHEDLLGLYVIPSSFHHQIGTWIRKSYLHFMNLTIYTFYCYMNTVAIPMDAR